jgi:glycosyltransferase involved in cell wall biosynthesis
MGILEAMFFGCPSVATSVGGIPEVIQDGVSGLLVPAGDAEQLSRAVEKLIQDVALRKSLGSTAQAHAQAKFSADAIIPLYESLYRSVHSSRDCNGA